MQAFKKRSISTNVFTIQINVLLNNNLVTSLCAGRRVDGLEQRLNGQEQSQRTLQELFMKLSQEVKVGH